MIAKQAYELAISNLDNNPTMTLIKQAAKQGRFSCSTDRVYNQVIFERMGYRFKWSSPNDPIKCFISWDHFK